MNLDPVPLEKLLRAETLSRQLSTLPREELENYTAQLIVLTTKLTHYTKAMRERLAEIELGIVPEG
jgi:hypothetical protein